MDMVVMLRKHHTAIFILWLLHLLLSDCVFHEQPEQFGNDCWATLDGTNTVCSTGATIGGIWLHRLKMLLITEHLNWSLSSLCSFILVTVLTLIMFAENPHYIMSFLLLSSVMITVFVWLAAHVSNGCHFPSKHRHISSIKQIMRVCGKPFFVIRKLEPLNHFTCNKDKKKKNRRLCTIKALYTITAWLLLIEYHSSIAGNL